MIQRYCIGSMMRENDRLLVTLTQVLGERPSRRHSFLHASVERIKKAMPRLGSHGGKSSHRIGRGTDTLSIVSKIRDASKRFAG